VVFGDAAESVAKTRRRAKMPLTLASRSYRRLLKILVKWPVDAEKTEGRDLGQVIRDQAPRYFPATDGSPADESRCDADLTALEDIANNKSKNLYARDPRKASVGALKLSAEELRRMTSTEGLKRLDEERSSLFRFLRPPSVVREPATKKKTDDGEQTKSDDVK